MILLRESEMSQGRIGGGGNKFGIIRMIFG